ncbi:hypothetical protein [Stenotrophomonas sp.]|uniref:hypothetical protein n=1 Tax=Stenotrophomonas sp. TaxID=69392 RepID=UPI0028A6DEFE|nr:hypothetical protein [Stenotrophomonas sp.]
MERKLDKEERVRLAAADKASRTRKHLLSLHHCLARSDVMRHHHDALVAEISTEGMDAFTDVVKVRFFAYLAFWFTALAGVIERYEALRNSGSIPGDPAVDLLLTTEFKDIVKRFRNSVAHCSEYDDRRTLEFFDYEDKVPDHAALLATAFHAYLKKHKGQ